MRMNKKIGKHKIIFENSGLVNNTWYAAIGKGELSLRSLMISR